MNTILTDDELIDAFCKHWHRGQFVDALQQAARRVEAAVLAKLREQEHHEKLEREHLGDPDKRTGIYAAPQPAVVQVPQGWNHAGHFYNLVAHALMDIGANHDGARFRLKEILKELEAIAAAPETPAQTEVQVPQGDAEWCRRCEGSGLEPAAPESPALPAEVREALKQIAENLRPIAHNSTDDPRGAAYEALARLDALGGGE